MAIQSIAVPPCPAGTGRLPPLVVGEKLIRLRELKEMTGISKSSIYSKLSPRSPGFDPSFPRKLKLGPCGCKGASAWLLSEVRAWIEKRAAERGPH